MDQTRPLEALPESASRLLRSSRTHALLGGPPKTWSVCVIDMGFVWSLPLVRFLTHIRASQGNLVIRVLHGPLE